jgi:hypothetical protein
MPNSCVKGKRGERAAAAYLTQLGFPARRGQQHKGGADSPDVICEGVNAHFEIKYGGKKYINFGATLDRALAKAESEAPRGKCPCVLWYQTGGIKRWALTMTGSQHYIGSEAIARALRPLTVTPTP